MIYTSFFWNTKYNKAIKNMQGKKEKQGIEHGKEGIEHRA